jgi:alcohol dehydrogenase class IV
MGVTFEFSMPVDVRFGRGRIAEVGQLLRALGARSVLLVSDPALVGTPVVAGIRSALDRAGIGVELFADVEVNPRVDQVERGVEAARETGADAIVGAGGGSSMDVAKAIGVLCANPGPINRYDGGVPVPEPGLPVVAIPTTAGTGSEVTPFANFSDKASAYKFAVGHRHFFATAAIVDPDATVSMPPAVTAATGMDALAHAVESYVARTAHPASEALALRAMNLIGRNLRRAHAAGDDIDAREAVLLGSTLAGMAFVSTRLGVLHALAMPLGGATDLPHGAILAALFAPGVRFNQPASPLRYRRVAEALGRDDGDAAAAIEELRRALALPARLSSPNVDAGTVERIAADALRSVNVRSNPAPMTREAMLVILRQVVETAPAD